MILVDSSAWIDYYSNPKSDISTQLRSIISNAPENIVIPNIVVTEVLQGIRNDNVYNDIKDSLLSYTIFCGISVNIYTDAAEIYRSCRKKGITINSTIDTIIASIALDNNLEILTADNDFYNIARLYPIRFYKA